MFQKELSKDPHLAVGGAVTNGIILWARKRAGSSGANQFDVPKPGDARTVGFVDNK
jgi:hypothetical protein